MKNDKHFCCPECGKKLARITNETLCKDLIVWCKQCKQEVNIHINFVTTKVKYNCKVCEECMNQCEDDDVVSIGPFGPHYICKKCNKE